MRALMALIGYVSTATVLASALGLTYLWQMRALDDEKVFRMVALLHDVDVDALNDEAMAEHQQAATPDEETSPDDIQRYRAVFARDYELKQDLLKRGRQEFDHHYQKLVVQTDRSEEFVKKIRQELERQSKLLEDEAVSQVVKHLEDLQAEAAKDLLIRTFNEQPNGVQDVILLMKAIKPSKLKYILQSFDEQERETLHEIHRVMRNGGAQQQLINNALGSDNLQPN